MTQALADKSPGIHSGGQSQGVRLGLVQDKEGGGAVEELQQPKFSMA